MSTSDPRSSMVGQDTGTQQVREQRAMGNNGLRRRPQQNACCVVMPTKAFTCGSSPTQMVEDAQQNFPEKPMDGKACRRMCAWEGVE